MKFFASLFKRDELQRRGITIDEEVGHGTYSKVYKGRLRRSEEVSTARCPSVTVPDRDTVSREVLNDQERQRFWKQCPKDICDGFKSRIST